MLKSLANEWALWGRYQFTNISFVIQMCQPQKQKTLCFDSQWGSGRQINDNRWRQRYLRYNENSWRVKSYTGVNAKPTRKCICIFPRTNLPPEENAMPGTHDWECTTSLYLWNGVLTDRVTFWLIFPRNQTFPANHKSCMNIYYPWD